MSNEAITITFTHMPTDLTPGEKVRQITDMAIAEQMEIQGESQPREHIEAAARAWVSLAAVAKSTDGVVRFPLVLAVMAHGIAAPTPTSTPQPSDTQPSQPSDASPTAEQT